MRVIVYAGYLIETKKLEAWSQAQTDTTYVRCREEHPAGAVLALRHYLRIKQKALPVRTHLFPFPEGNAGRYNADRWYAMLYLHHEDYEVYLNRFADWKKYEQDGSDAQLIEVIKDLGIPAYGEVTWKVVAWVGTIGLFYGFSPKVIEEIYERMKAYQAAKAAQQTCPSALIAWHAADREL